MAILPSKVCPQNNSTLIQTREQSEIDMLVLASEFVATHTHTYIFIYICMPYIYLLIYLCVDMYA